jgi:hypothetical protein
MTDLSKLTVSLTKHGAHKIAPLIEIYGTTKILNHLSDSVAGINIDAAQARKNLSVDRNEKVPEVWEEARELGRKAVDALTLISIIFSHYKLIDAMVNSSSPNTFTGRIERGEYLDGKEFTNFAHIIEQLGYSVDHQHDYVEYNLRGMFEINGLPKLTQKMLTHKLVTAKWNKKNSLIDEISNLGFHGVFSVTREFFVNWLSNGLSDGDLELELDSDDIEFFTGTGKEELSGDFIFSPGHNNKKTGAVKVNAKTEKISANLLHNSMQNDLNEILVKKFGKNHVSTENSTGQGTSIDIVVKTKDFCWFYEIKTTKSVKACIRQAIPQLLEYAYWPNDNRADRLIIVGPSPITERANEYLALIRKRFGIPLYYKQYCVESNQLI